MTGKDFSGPVPEIQVPAVQPTLQPEAPGVLSQDTELPLPAKRAKRKHLTPAPDEGLIIGDVEEFGS